MNSEGDSYFGGARACLCAHCCKALLPLSPHFEAQLHLRSLFLLLMVVIWIPRKDHSVGGYMIENDIWYLAAFLIYHEVHMTITALKSGNALLRLIRILDLLLISNFPHDI